MKVVRASAPHTGHFYPRKCSWYSFSLGVSQPQSHGTVGRDTSLKNPVKPPGIDPGTVRLVAQRLNHYATLGPSWDYIGFKYLRHLSSQDSILFSMQCFFFLLWCSILYCCCHDTARAAADGTQTQRKSVLSGKIYGPDYPNSGTCISPYPANAENMVRS
jgi:hypothetical protein